MDAKPEAPRKSSRRLAREYAVQGIYQSLLSGNEAPDIIAHLSEDAGFSKVDHKLFRTLLRGALDNAEALRVQFGTHLDRKVEELSPVEHAILLVATFELANMIETPYRVVINEAIELTKEFGGADGHKFVNGVLDKLAPQLRAVEVEAARNRPRG
ncbi:transcription antitermination factor NusB [Methyloversatilis discipulorum]|uniref:transcription antitermination factor NusB n=1 Tax=Methyloversatilis discipulorum TaxID=1119528 RepID=UPI001A44A3FD|nr:transcription antitermination factor NusB [Methyloversatilis discipulorum]MBL8467706.1 transcription antitermination factor NusB [Methyloversatilis discipulorum]